MTGRSENGDGDEDLDFVYGDCDSFISELGELYSYTEENEFALNQECFKEILGDERKWIEMTLEEKKVVIMKAMDGTDVVNSEKKFRAVRSLLYIAQGNFTEFATIEELLKSSRKNCFLLYEMGVFGLAEELLLMEIHKNEKEIPDSKNPTVCSIVNSSELRIVISLLYTMLETIRQFEESDSEKFKKARDAFITLLNQSNNGNESLFVVLFNMVTKFCNHNITAYPIKKVLLLLWKVVLAMVGGLDDLHQLKCKKREEAGLPRLAENPIEVARKMKASAPPMNAADLFDQGQPGRRKNRRGIIRGPEVVEVSGSENKSESSGDIDVDIHIPGADDEDSEKEEMIENGADLLPAPSDQNEVEKTDEDIIFDSEIDAPVPGGGIDTPAVGIGTPAPFKRDPTPGDTAAIALKLMKIKAEREEEHALKDLHVIKVPSGLHWTPKTRERDVEIFLSQVRQKFVGFQLEGDVTTMAGLPTPTKESVKILRKHLYVSLAEKQIEIESQIGKYPLTKAKLDVIPDNSAEKLYQSILPNLPQYMISLLKILLAAAPTSKAKSDAINILADVLPPEIPYSAVQSVRLGIDVNRHREIIVKSISAILLLLLKHFKLNHVYQYEYMSQHLVFANCIPLVLKFFNQNIVAYVTTKNVIPSLEYPACVVGEKVEITAESLEPVDTQSAACWRNLFSSINLLRILNKLVKWKHSRTMMLVVFKSSPILKRALKVRQAMLQLYVLKLLKSQTKYLGRAWRKSNMKIMSAIYQKVRHRLSDDWAYGNDVDARPWDFQQEECTLRAEVERFNFRRYKTDSPTIIPPNQDHEPVDNDLHSVLGEKFDLPNEFVKNYDIWLEREVYSTTTDWDQLLSISCVQ
ncbi:striatin-interacting protein 1 homolog [Styela clava]